MAKSKSRRKSSSSPDAVLTVLLTELEWLSAARSDASVTEEVWLRRSRAASLRAQRLPGEYREVFEQKFLLLHQLQAAEQMEQGLAAHAASPATPSDTASAP